MFCPVTVKNKQQKILLYSNALFFLVKSSHLFRKEKKVSSTFSVYIFLFSHNISIDESYILYTNYYY